MTFFVLFIVLLLGMLLIIFEISNKKITCGICDERIYSNYAVISRKENGKLFDECKVCFRCAELVDISKIEIKEINIIGKPKETDINGK